MKGFSQFITESERSREGHLCWRGVDLEHEVDEDTYSHLRDLPTTPDLKETHLSDDEVRHHLAHVNSLDDDLFGHVLKYKDMSHGYNHQLRSASRIGGSLDLRPAGYHSFTHTNPGAIHALSRVTSNPIPKDMTVYRGLTRDTGAHRLPVGRHFLDHGFTGTSLDPREAAEFMTPHNRYHPADSKVPWSINGKGMIAKIHVPAGTKGHYLDVGGGRHDTDIPNDHEREFLLHRGSRFQITGHSLSRIVTSDTPEVKAEYPVHVVHMSVVGQHPKKLIDGMFNR